MAVLEAERPAQGEKGTQTHKHMLPNAHIPRTADCELLVPIWTMRDFFRRLVPGAAMGMHKVEAVGDPWPLAILVPQREGCERKGWKIPPSPGPHMPQWYNADIGLSARRV